MERYMPPSTTAQFRDAAKEGIGGPDKSNYTPGQESKETKLIGDNAKHLAKVIDSLRNVRLSGGVKDVRQADELKERKKRTIDLVRNVVSSATEYKAAIGQDIPIAENEEVDIGNFIKAMKVRDAKRQEKHNALIEAVINANQYIKNNFGLLSPEEQKTLAYDETKSGRPTLNVERIKLPPSIICPSYVNIKDRSTIEEWANKLIKELASFAIDYSV